MNVSGTDIPNQRASRMARVLKGTAALLASIKKIRFSTIEMPNTTLNKTSSYNNLV